MPKHDSQRLVVLYEDNHLLVVNKPCGLATMGDGERETLHSLAASYLKHKYNKPHAAYVGIVSRLDSMTSGVIVLARTSKAAARLNAQFAEHANRLGKRFGSAASLLGKKDGANDITIDDAIDDATQSVTTFRKTYLAVVRAEPRPDVRLPADGRMFDYLSKDDASHRMRAVSTQSDQSKAASLVFQTLASNEHLRIVGVAPLTGRKHQIRVQFAARGWPILGDRKYGSTTPWQNGIALHSYRLTIEHPTLREAMTFHCAPPPSWNLVQTNELRTAIKQNVLTAIPRASGKRGGDDGESATRGRRDG